MICKKIFLILFFNLILFYSSLSNAQTSDLKILLNPKVGDVKKIGLGQIYSKTPPRNIGEIVFKEFRLVWLNSKGVVLPFEGVVEGDKYSVTAYAQNHDLRESRAINVGFYGVDLIQNPKEEHNSIDNKNYTVPDKLYFVSPDSTEKSSVKSIFIQLLNDNEIIVPQGGKSDLEWIVVNIKDVESILMKELIPNHTDFLFILQNKAKYKELPEFLLNAFHYNKGETGFVPQIPFFYADIARDPIIPSKITGKIDEITSGQYYFLVSNGAFRYYGTNTDKELLYSTVSQLNPEMSFNFLVHLQFSWMNNKV